MLESISWFEAWARWFSTGPLEPHTLMMVSIHGLSCDVMPLML
jgi:hypothetical protein